MSKNTVEIEAVERIRERNPMIPQRTLARKIDEADFEMGTLDHVDSFRVSPRTPLPTIYNRIRRIDGSIK